MSNERSEASAAEWLGDKLLDRLFPLDGAPDPSIYDRPIEQAWGSVCTREETFRREREEAGKEIVAFLDLSPNQRGRRLERNYWRLKNRSFVLELLRHSRRAIWTDPSEAAQLAEYALQAFQQIKGHRLVRQAGGRLGLADLEAQVYGQLGNVARLRRRWLPAYRHFCRAFAAYERGSQDPEIEANLHSLYGSLLRDRRDFTTAFESLRTAAAIYGELRDDHRRGKVLLQQATVLWETEQPRPALRLHMEGTVLLDEDTEPEVALASWSNLANLYYGLEEPEAALSMLKGSVGLARRLPATSSARLCWIWVAGRVALARGAYKAAERRLLRTRLGFAERGDVFRAGQVALDLSHLYAVQQRLDDLSVLMPEAVAQLRNQNLHRDAEKAIDAYRLAVEQRQAQVLSVILSTVSALEQHSRGPESTAR